jgi:hypothetical protein
MQAMTTILEPPILIPSPPLSLGTFSFLFMTLLSSITCRLPLRCSRRYLLVFDLLFRRPAAKGGPNISSFYHGISRAIYLSWLIMDLLEGLQNGCDRTLDHMCYARQRGRKEGVGRKVT